MSNTLVDLIQELTARLSSVATEFGERAGALDQSPADQQPSEQMLSQRARQLLADRRARRSCFPGDLFHEPAWDMLIGLFICRDDQRPVNVKALATYADAPITTCQRWIEQLFRLGLITRTIDPLDRRRVEVALSEAGLAAMTAYLSSIPVAVKSR